MPSSFSAIPSDAAAVLRPALPRLADEAIATIAVEVPEYQRAMEGAFGQIVREGVETAFNRFLDRIADPEAPGARAESTYVDLGRGEYHLGRRLDALLAAYRVGARVAWRRFVEAGVAGGLEPAVIYELGEAIWAYIDELSAESVAGYAEEQSAAAGESERRRRRLVRLLAQDPAPPRAAIRAAAREAGWLLPRQLAALVAARGEEAPEGEGILDDTAARLARRLGGGAIGAAVEGVACVFVPDPDAPGRRRQLAAAIEEPPAALGPTVEPPAAAVSVRRAAAAHRLAASGRLPTDGLVVADDHLAALVLAADPALAADLAAVRLAPLDALPEDARPRLEATLRAWLDRPGQVQAVAAALDVHPQTVRYRVRRLRELFGPRLEDPDGRFELALALRAR